MVTGELHREHWTVPVGGLTSTDPDGTVQAIAYCDGTVVLNSSCGPSRTVVRLDVCKAAQLSTGIWEAAGAAQLLTDGLGEDQPASQPPEAGNPLQVWRDPPRRTAPIHDRSPNRRRLPPVNQDAARDARRTVGLRIRRLRHTRNKSLQTIAGLAGMSITTLHRIEHGRRDLTLSDVAALANALQTDPTKLIVLPILTPASR